jgi:hypothetical protein
VLGEVPGLLCFIGHHQRCMPLTGAGSDGKLEMVSYHTVDDVVRYPLFIL